MAWPLALGTSIACGAGWLLVRPLLAAMTSKMTPRRAGLVRAGLLAALSLLFFAVRLAPLGMIGLLAASGIAARAMKASADMTPPTRAGMSRAEALSVLGLAPGADGAAIEAAHRRMIVRAHPDQGGSDYLAAKVNEARAVLRGSGAD